MTKIGMNLWTKFWWWSDWFVLQMPKIHTAPPRMVRNWSNVFMYASSRLQSELICLSPYVQRTLVQIIAFNMLMTAVSLLVKLPSLTNTKEHRLRLTHRWKKNNNQMKSKKAHDKKRQNNKPTTQRSHTNGFHSSVMQYKVGNYFTWLLILLQ